MRNTQTARSFRLSRIAIPLLAVFWLAVTTLPFLFVVMTSLKTAQETFTASVFALPERINLVNYASVMHSGFWTYLRNSVFVVAVSIALGLRLRSRSTTRNVAVELHDTTD